jgi:exosortase
VAADLSTSASLPVTGHAVRSFAWIAACVLGAFFVAGLSPLLAVLHKDWINPYGAFSHGYLVLLMSVWLALVRWRESPPAKLAPSWPAVTLVLGLVLSLCAMDALSLNHARLVVLPLLAEACIAAVFGLRCARTLLLPVAFMFLALPQWWAINSPLQALTTAVVGAMIEVTNTPAVVAGNDIHVAGGTIEIGFDCSGLSFVLAALSFAGFYGLVLLPRWSSRLGLLAAAALFALAANWIRVYSLVRIGIATEMNHYLIRVEHVSFGWVVFILMMAPVLWLARRLAHRAEQAFPARLELQMNAVKSSGAWTTLPAAFVTGCLLLIPKWITT